MGKKRVLLVEDHPLNRELVCDLLEVSGFEISVATVAEQAIQMARAEPFELILMDISLPGMSGLEAIRILKDDASTSPIPIVALTSHAMPGDQRTAMEAGCVAYLCKPINTREFAGQVASYLRK